MSQVLDIIKFCYVEMLCMMLRRIVLKFRSLDWVGCWAMMALGSSFTGMQGQGLRKRKMQAAASSGDICLGTGQVNVFQNREPECMF